MVCSKSMFQFCSTRCHSVWATTLLKSWIKVKQPCDDIYHSSNQPTRNRRNELLKYLYLVHLYDEFKSACSVRQLFNCLPRSEHLQNQPDSSVSCRKWFSGQRSGCASQAYLKDNPHRALQQIKGGSRARSSDRRSTSKRCFQYHQ